MTVPRFNSREMVDLWHPITSAIACKVFPSYEGRQFARDHTA
ncbi:MAG: hypothetical protein BSOLF_0073 [Candidatus Carbobacillus altaicus]|uniref:Uncharacterized protein n=1 Tax=Candidatus Carbonibacillus altaicus TaxID=2163959 RepID=A0A2R6XXK5_9BACL|nr:MAG: hypothetical protein BSOLF_0073 [Candidatus Carbobacillus altaicus]